MENTNAPYIEFADSKPAEEADPEITLAWLAAGHLATPADALVRIRYICEKQPDLFSAMFAVLATHQALPREILAAAVKQFRRDTDALPQHDVAGLLTAIWNGGRPGFDTVLRTRKGERKATPAAALPWASKD